MKKTKINFNFPRVEFNYLNNQILISCYHSHEILIFNSSFDFISSIKEKNKFKKEENQFKYPSEIKFNSQNNLIIGDGTNISIFDDNYNFLFSINQSQSFSSLIYFTLDKFDNIISNGNYKNLFYFFESNGNLISKLNSKENSSNSRGICFGNKKKTSILICDGINHKIKIIECKILKNEIKFNFLK